MLSYESKKEKKVNQRYFHLLVILVLSEISTINDVTIKFKLNIVLTSSKQSSISEPDPGQVNVGLWF